MEKPKNTAITCYVGLTVVRREVLARVNSYKQKIEKLLSQKASPLTEAHITLVTPFHTDYETASRINLGCGVSVLLPENIVNSTVFYMEGIASMQFEGDTIIHFPIGVKGKGGEAEIFRQRVQSFRQQIKAFGGELRGKVPSDYTPHISVYTKWKGSMTKEFKDLIQKSKREPVIYFQATYPTLYTKYAGLGYRELTSNPNN